MDREELYNKLDKEEGMSDKEKREIYYSEIANEEAEEEWENGF